MIHSFRVLFSNFHINFCKVFDDNQLFCMCCNKFLNKRISRIVSISLQEKYEMSVLNSLDRVPEMSWETVPPEGKIKFEYHIMYYTRLQPDILCNYISKAQITTKRHRLNIMKLVSISTFIPILFRKMLFLFKKNKS